MTIEEKRRKVHDYCRRCQSCEDCIFNIPVLNWTKKFEGEHCLDIDLSPESDLDKALRLIGYKDTPTESPTETDNAPTETDNAPTDSPIRGNVEHHMEIVSEMNKLYERKNKDYGDSFHMLFLEEGMAMARIRLSDKLNRFKTLTKSDSQEVKDESIRDTLIDLANYAIMTIMEIDRKE